MITRERKVDFVHRGRLRHSSGDDASVGYAGRVSRVSRLMALAIRFECMIRHGVVANQAELARFGRVSRPRLTQIMNLLQLAPDIQESLLFLPVAVGGRDAITERQLRSVVAHLSWYEQRRHWKTLSRQLKQ